MTATLQYIVRNREAIGFLLSAGPKGIKAFDQDGRSLGLFEDADKAARAVSEAASQPN